MSKTVDYFPHYIKKNRTLEMLEGRFDVDGYIFYFRLFEILGGEELFFYDCRPLENLEFLSGKIGVDTVRLVEIIDFLSVINRVDKDLWNHKILWFQEFVDSLKQLYLIRRKPLPESRDVLVFLGVNPVKTLVNPVKTLVNPVKTLVNTGLSTQSKVKESKGKESKEKKTDKKKEIEKRQVNESPVFKAVRLLNLDYSKNNLDQVIKILDLSTISPVDYFKQNENDNEFMSNFYTRCVISSGKQKDLIKDEQRYTSSVFNALNGKNMGYWDLEKILQVCKNKCDSELARLESQRKNKSFNYHVKQVLEKEKEQEEKQDKIIMDTISRFSEVDTELLKSIRDKVTENTSIFLNALPQETADQIVDRKVADRVILDGLLDEKNVNLALNKEVGF